MRALYIGDRDGTSRHRSDAMRRLGWEVEHIDPRDCFRKSRLAEIWIWRAGSLGMEPFVKRYILGQMRHDRYDICVVSHGELLGPAVVRALKSRAAAILNYNGDNPFVPRDMKRWRLFLKSMHLYDLHATPRMSTAEKGAGLGLKMHRFIQTADEVVHRPYPVCNSDKKRYSSDVAFIGTWMPERGPFVATLLEAGISVRVFGANWSKAPEFGKIKNTISIGYTLGDEEYTKAIQYARVSLGFVSEANGDSHTGRSVEVPAIGSLLCAKRTSEHKLLYQEDAEAVFWENMDECISKCRALMAQPTLLHNMAKAGAARQAKSQHWNEILMTRLIDEALANAGRASQRPPNT